MKLVIMNWNDGRYAMLQKSMGTSTCFATCPSSISFGPKIDQSIRTSVTTLVVGPQ